MHVNDIILAALTQGTAFNPNGKIWRSIGTLKALTQLEHGEVLGILGGDLAQQVTIKVGKKGQVLAALKVNLATPTIKVAVGNAHIQPLVAAASEAVALQEPVQTVTFDEVLVQMQNEKKLAKDAKVY